MKSLLDDINQIDFFIGQLQKLSSIIRSGRDVDAYRECNKLLSCFIKAKQDLLKEAESKEEKSEK